MFIQGWKQMIKYHGRTKLIKNMVNSSGTMAEGTGHSLLWTGNRKTHPTGW
jgi:hypothetical protein